MGRRCHRVLLCCCHRSPPPCCPDHETKSRKWVTMWGVPFPQYAHALWMLRSIPPSNFAYLQMSEICYPSWDNTRWTETRCRRGRCRSPREIGVIHDAMTIVIASDQVFQQNNTQRVTAHVVDGHLIPSGGREKRTMAESYNCSWMLHGAVIVLRQ